MCEDGILKSRLTGPNGISISVVTLFMETDNGHRIVRILRLALSMSTSRNIHAVSIRAGVICRKSEMSEKKVRR